MSISPIALVLGGWRIGLAVGVLVAILGFVGLFAVTPQYAAVVLLKPADEAELRTPAAGYLGFAEALLGAPSDSPDFVRFTELVYSNMVAHRLIRDYDIHRALFEDRWDEAKRAWRNPGPVGRLSRAFYHAVGVAVPAEPGADDVQEYLRRHLVIREIPRRSLWSATLRHHNRHTAQTSLQLVVTTTNDLLREQAQREVAGTLEYLQSKADQTANVELRAALAAIWGQQIRAQMLTEIPAPFAARPLGEVHSPSLPSWPRLSVYLPVVLSLSAVLGLLASIVVGFIRAWPSLGWKFEY